MVDEMEILEIAEIIGNKKIIAAVNADNKQTARNIAAKLYHKARAAQDKNEHLLSMIIQWADNKTVNFKECLDDYNHEIQNDLKEKAFKDLCASHAYQNADSLKKFDMQLDAWGK